MERLPLAECHYLDVRPAPESAAAPYADAVNIPLDEFPQRTHELPPRGERVLVVGPAELTERAVLALRDLGRIPVQGEPGKPAPRNAPPTVGRLWRPNDYLTFVAPRLSPGRALDLACGVGREAVYLASLGWEVTAIDVLPDALDRARDLAVRCAPAIMPITWLVRDLERDPPSYAAEFDLVVGFRFLHRPLFKLIPGWLRPGGGLVWETFTTEHRARHGKPRREHDVVRPGELRALLSERLQIIHSHEGSRGHAHTARIWAERPA
jgi:tellurite methyltransferase